MRACRVRVHSSFFSVETFLLVNVLFAATRGLLAEAAPISKSKIATLARSRMVKDTGLSKEEAKKIPCENIINRFDGLASKLPFAKEMIENLFQDKDFKIVCSTVKHIKNQVDPRLSGGQTTAAYFRPSENLISISTEIDDQATLHHELIHAYWYAQHKPANPDKTRRDNIYRAFSPILHFTPDEINDYQDALNKGDTRILEFSKLLKRQRSGKTLSSNQQSKLNDYIHASSHCLIQTRIVALAPDEYMPNDVLMTVEGYRVKIMSTEITKDGVIGYAKYVDPHQSMLDSILNFLHQRDQFYPYESIFHELAEHDAHVFMTMDSRAKEVFYPEAHALREAVFEACKKPANTPGLRISEL